MISNDKMIEILNGIFSGMSRVDWTKKERKSVDINLNESEDGFVTLAIKFSSYAGHVCNVSLKFNTDDPDAFPDGEADVQEIRDDIAEFKKLQAGDLDDGK